MKIDNSIKTLGRGFVQQEPARNAQQQAQDGSSPTSTNVKLSPLSSQIKLMEKVAAEAPVVDAARVAELKAAISEGRFKVNAEAVADRLIATVQELIRSHKA